MKTLIAYASRYGTTRECARSIAEKIGGETRLVDLRREGMPDLAGYDSVVVGGPIYGGKIVRVVRRFCEQRRDELLLRRVGLFVCCLYEGETARAELEEAFPAWLNSHALIRRALGGAIAYESLSSVDRYLVRRVARLGGNIRTVKEDEICAVAETMSARTTNESLRRTGSMHVEDEEPEDEG